MLLHIIAIFNGGYIEVIAVSIPVMCNFKHHTVKPSPMQAWQSFFDAVIEGQFYLNATVDGSLDGCWAPMAGDLRRAVDIFGKF